MQLKILNMNKILYDAIEASRMQIGFIENETTNEIYDKLNEYIFDNKEKVNSIYITFDDIKWDIEKTISIDVRTDNYQLFLTMYPYRGADSARCKLDVFHKNEYIHTLYNRFSEIISDMQDILIVHTFLHPILYIKLHKNDEKYKSTEVQQILNDLEIFVNKNPNIQSLYFCLLDIDSVWIDMYAKNGKEMILSRFYNMIDDGEPDVDIDGCVHYYSDFEQKKRETFAGKDIELYAKIKELINE